MFLKLFKQKVVKRYKQWVILAGFLICTEAAILFLYGLCLRYFELPEISVLAYLLVALIFSILPFVLKWYRISINRLVLYFIGAFLVLSASLTLLVILPQSSTELQIPENTIETFLSAELYEKELFEAINKKRKENMLRELDYERSTCVLAKARVKEVFEKDVSIIGWSASFQRATDKIFKEDQSLIATAPHWYQEAVTYQETVVDAIKEWEDNVNTQRLFTNELYQVGCVSEFGGYAVVVTGYWDKNSKSVYREADIYPKGLENKKLESF